MTFTAAELEYLRTTQLGRLATVAPDGTLQNSPVGFSVDEATGTIRIGGFRMETSRKYRNVGGNPQVAFVVDDVVSADPWRVRCLELRGTAEAVPAGDGHAAEIHVHPRRIISFGVERTDQEPHEMTPNNRDV